MRNLSEVSANLRQHKLEHFKAMNRFYLSMYKTLDELDRIQPLDVQLCFNALYFCSCGLKEAFIASAFSLSRIATLHVARTGERIGLKVWK